MKIISMDGRLFVRSGSRTHAPLDAIRHSQDMERQAALLLAEAVLERDKEQQAYRAALTELGVFDRDRLRKAEVRVQAAEAEHRAAVAMLDETRALLAEHSAKARVAAAEAATSDLLARFPLETLA
jgi:hypothetical protein